MTVLIKFCISVLLCCAFFGCKPHVDLDTDVKKFSYSYGAIIGKDLRKQEVEIDLGALKEGIEAAYNDTEMLMSATEVDATYMTFQKSRYSKLKRREEKIIKLNVKEGKTFLAKNSKKKGVVTYENGLQYKIIKEGTGKKPGLDSVVSLHFIDKFVDGTVFYNTYEQVNPVQFTIGSPPKGWSLAIPLMKEGALWEIYLPGSLAYAEQSIPNAGPFKTVISRIEFIEIVDNYKLIK